MAGRPDFAAYRDAVGILLASKRGDDEAILYLMRQSSKVALVTALSAIGSYLMKELDAHDDDAEALVRRWALNVARAEAREEAR